MTTVRVCAPILPEADQLNPAWETQLTDLRSSGVQSIRTSTDENDVELFLGELTRPLGSNTASCTRHDGPRAATLALERLDLILALELGERGTSY